MTDGTTAGRLLRAHDRPATRWRNGGGVTREVVAGPAEAGMEDFAWRVSLADVAAGGPFSSFPGVDRIITVVDGPGMELTVDGVPHTVDAPYEPFAFPGDAVTDCRLLGGPLVDFNVMTRRSAATARLRLTREAFDVTPRAGSETLVIVLAGTATAAESGVTLDRFDAVLFPEDGADTFHVDGVAAVVTVAPAAGA
ncbi:MULTISPECIES: HutD family protein [Streptomyces]|uniref:HutD family protein n=1 Tax=Streptomyces solicathayae TaxID=3081768 RepID=A0ABZ0M2A3_9ACTN|nr:HutD family protein [Streptomyces sp. HUAS YS2]WOX25857.1 HutD family protein [Streptomyces sp. HUAS YS2]